MKRHLILAAVLAFAAGLAVPRIFAQVDPSSYVNFEGAQTNPVRLSPDGTRLFAVNTPDARVSVFDVTQPASPVLIAEIPVGIEPVSVNARSADEAWVVNEESDSISVVSVSKGVVTDTIYVKDEPSDVVFSGTQAFVSVARSSVIRVFNVTTHNLLKTIPVVGGMPRAMAVSPDGTTVYAAFALSGNHTTIIPPGVAPPQSPPTNPALPPPPVAGLIVDASDPAWTSVVKYTMPDNDIVAIDVPSLSVRRYYTGVGTVNFGMAVRPTTGDLYVTNTNARNLIHFEPTLKGHFVDNRVTWITVNGQVTPFDLNSGINYSAPMPNPQAQSIALAQPAGIVFNAAGLAMYIASFGTDRVAKVDILGNVLKRIEIGNTPGAGVDPRHKRGPRGLALNTTANKLYVLNRISNTLTVIDTATDTVLGEIPTGTFDPTPQVIRDGRGFLYDAKLSGTGTAACAGCHIDAEMDFLAWDLGNPGGDMASVTQDGQVIQFHPMKGPITTQTLRGLNNLAPYHWRGDRADFAAFNPAFQSLMGGTQLSTDDMNAFTNFINTVVYQPNPYQNLDRTLPNSLFDGNANTGLATFMSGSTTLTVACNTCHTANPGPGSDRLIHNRSNDTQPLKTPQLRNMYQKTMFNNTANQPSVQGFGFASDGSISTLFGLLSQPNLFGQFAGDTQGKVHMIAYLMSFDTGMAPAVGYTRTISPSNVITLSVQNDWTTLQGQAAAGNIDLIVKGSFSGASHGLLYQPATNTYQLDITGAGTFTRAQLSSLALSGATFSVMGVPVGSGVRMGLDRNLDGVLDGDGSVTLSLK